METVKGIQGDTVLSATDTMRMAVTLIWGFLCSDIDLQGLVGRAWPQDSKSPVFATLVLHTADM